MRSIGRSLTLLSLMTGLALVAASIDLAGGGQAQAPRKKLLFLTHPGINPPGHASLPAAEKMAVGYGKSSGFDVTVHEGYKTVDAPDVRFLTPQYLNSFDGLMLMTNGNLPLTLEQKRAIVDFVRDGKGFVGVHCASLTMYDYPEFGEMLGGHYVRSIVPMPVLANKRISVLKVEDTTHPATKMLGSSWPLVEEYYLFAWTPWSKEDPAYNVTQPGNFHPPLGFSRERVHVLLSLDTERTNLEGYRRVVKGGDYPQAWWRYYGQGRSFYTSLGHEEASWTHDPVFRAHLTGGIRWALGLEEIQAPPSPQTSTR